MKSSRDKSESHPRSSVKHPGHLALGVLFSDCRSCRHPLISRHISHCVLVRWALIGTTGQDNPSNCVSSNCSSRIEVHGLEGDSTGGRNTLHLVRDETIEVMVTSCDN